MASTEELQNQIAAMRRRLKQLEDLIASHISYDSTSDYPHTYQRVATLEFAGGLRLDNSLANPTDGYVLTADSNEAAGLKWAPGGGGVTDGDKGDITVSGGGTNWQIDPGAVGTPELADNAVTMAKLQDINTNRLLGRSSAGTGDTEEISIGTGLQLSSGVLSATGGGGVTDGDKGDITVSGGGTNWEIDPGAVGTPELSDNAVTFAKMQDINTQRLIGRSTAGTGDPEEISIGSGLLLSGGTLSATGGGGVSDGDKGDITVSGGGTTWTIDDDVVTFAKMQNISQYHFIVRASPGTGDPEQRFDPFARFVGGWFEHFDSYRYYPYIYTFSVSTVLNISPNTATAGGAGNAMFILQPTMNGLTVTFATYADYANMVTIYPFLIVNNSDYYLNLNWTTYGFGALTRGTRPTVLRPREVIHGFHRINGQPGGIMFESWNTDYPRPYVLPFHTDATANITLANQPNSEQFLANSWRTIRSVDISRFTQVRLVAIVTTVSASANNPRLYVEYSTSFSTSVGSYQPIGTSAVEISLAGTTGHRASSWIDLDPAVRQSVGDIFVAVLQNGGNGAADPALGYVAVEFR